LKLLRGTIYYVLLIIGVVILSIAFGALISAIQSMLFLPKDYTMWIFKYPINRLFFIFELYIIILLIHILKKGLKWTNKSEKNVVKKRKKTFIVPFAIVNIILLYTIIFNVTVITNNKIINYTFSCPQGKEYSYKDVVKIEAGVYGKKSNIPYSHGKGDFYYIIKLNDGTRIDLAEAGGVNIYYDEDPRFILERLDRELVKLDVSKVSSMENFQYCTKNLAKIYTDKIRSILENKK